MKGDWRKRERNDERNMSTLSHTCTPTMTENLTLAFFFNLLIENKLWHRRTPRKVPTTHIESFKYIV